MNAGGREREHKIDVGQTPQVKAYIKGTIKKLSQKKKLKKVAHMA